MTVDTFAKLPTRHWPKLDIRECVLSGYNLLRGKWLALVDRLRNKCHFTPSIKL